jgi:three-Cys-motif partner protein
VVADLARYAGREQAYVKHYFLENYLGRLLHKAAARFDHIVYIDGFSGPWQSSQEQFEDTSFGIALGELRKAKSTWRELGRDREMSAFLVEKSQGAFGRLQEVGPRFPDVLVRPFRGDFVELSNMLLAEIPAGAFAFILIDPKGWRIPLKAIGPMLARENTEVVFNFMFDFINRAASMSDPALIAGLDELIPVGAWRDRLGALRETTSREDTPAARKAILVDAFKEAVSALGGYPYVMDIPVMRPVKDRMLYSLVYATRKPIGVEVFRDCQLKTLREQENVRGVIKIAHVQAGSKQNELFGSMRDMSPGDMEQYLASEQAAAGNALGRLIPAQPSSVRYSEIWPKILLWHAVRKTDLNRMVADLRRQGDVRCINWRDRQRVPDDDTCLQRIGPSSI